MTPVIFIKDTDMDILYNTYIYIYIYPIWPHLSSFHRTSDLLLVPSAYRLRPRSGEGPKEQPPGRAPKPRPIEAGWTSRSKHPGFKPVGRAKNGGLKPLEQKIMIEEVHIRQSLLFIKPKTGIWGVAVQVLWGERPGTAGSCASVTALED